jgi:hypothetical protein
MTTFKVGDQVKYIGTFSPELINRCGTVTGHNSPRSIQVDWGKPEVFNTGVMPENICLFDPAKEQAEKIEQAKALLENNGYTITEPKPKLTGTVYVRTDDRAGSVWLCPHDPGLNDNPSIKTIAVLNWTEGDGIPKQT